MKPKIYFANESDTPQILKFIRDLAEFEKLESEVETTEEKLKESLFGSKKYAEVIFIELSGCKAGFALFFHNYSTFLGKPGIYLEDLYIRPEFRGQGLGKALLSFLAKLAIERGCGRLEWWVLNWNKQAIDFYISLGARAMSEWTVHRVSGEALHKLSDG